MTRDAYHFHRDPAELIEARLTKNEAEAVASYRAAREQTPSERVKNLVMIIPIAEELIGSDISDEIESDIRQMAGDAAVDAIQRERNQP